MNQNPQPLTVTPAIPQGGYTATPPTPKKQKPLFNLTKGDAAFTVFSVCLCIFAVAFGICQSFFLGIGLTVVFTLVLFSVYLSRGKKVKFGAWMYGILALSTSAVFITTTNPEIRAAGLIMGCLLALTCFYEIAVGKTKGNRQTIGIFYNAGCSLTNIGISVKSLFANKRGEKKIFGKVLLGLVCALPVVTLVLALLITSDDAFRGMMEQLFSNTFATLLKCIFGIGIALLMIAHGFSLKHTRTAKIKNSSFGGIDTVYVVSFLGAVSLCYVLYLFSQLAYFFNAFQGFLPDGMPTYSAYARQGFFEMCIIALINLALVLLTFLFTRKKEGTVHPLVKGVATFIGAFTLIIVATALSKMVLYIGTYGMTVLRITTSAFMVFTAIVFAGVILRIYSPKINVVKTALVSAGCLLILLGTVNVNGVCAKYNYHRYLNKPTLGIDVQALYELGDEGIPYLVALAQNDPDYGREAMTYLANAYLHDYFEDMRYKDDFTLEDLTENQKWKEFGYYSIPKQRAYNSLYQFVEDNPNFPSLCQSYANYYADSSSVWEDLFFPF